METKNHQGPHSCYAKAMPDEPMFVLLGRDPAAPMAILRWIELRQQIKGQGVDAAQLEEASHDAQRFEKWRLEHDGQWRDYDPSADLVPTPRDEISSLAGQLMHHDDERVRKIAAFVQRSDPQAGPNG